MKEESMDVFTFDGVNRQGKDSGGQTTRRSASDLAEYLFARGWREAVVRRVGSSEIVGGVSRHPDTRRRTWWGERGQSNDLAYGADPRVPVRLDVQP
jgi:hypothetical protein